MADNFHISELITTLILNRILCKKKTNNPHDLVSSIESLKIYMEDLQCVKDESQSRGR